MMRARLYAIAVAAMLLFVPLGGNHALATSVEGPPPSESPEDIAIHFPDANFEAAVRKIIEKPTGDIMASDVADVIVLDVADRRISDLAGIEYFTALEMLYCGWNRLTNLDVSHNAALKILECSEDLESEGGNALTTLDVSQNTVLTELHCSGNQLTELDLHNNPSLEILACDDNQLKALDVNPRRRPDPGICPYACRWLQSLLRQQWGGPVGHVQYVPDCHPAQRPESRAADQQDGFGGRVPGADRGIQWKGHELYDPTNAGDTIQRYMAQTVNLTPGKTYTFSCYVKRQGNIGLTLAHHVVDAQQGDVWGETPDLRQDTESGEYVRVSHTFTLPVTAATGATTLCVITKGQGASATVRMDAAQLEEAPVASRFNLLENGDFGFNVNGKPEKWEELAGNSEIDLVYPIGQGKPEGYSPNALRLHGSPVKQAGIYQDIDMGGKKDTMFTIGGWAKAMGAQLRGRNKLCSMRIGFYTYRLAQTRCDFRSRPSCFARRGSC